PEALLAPLEPRRPAVGARRLVERRAGAIRLPRPHEGAGKLVLTLDARRVHLDKALEVREGLARLVAIEVVVGETEMRQAVAQTGIPAERLLDEWTAAASVAESEERRAQVVAGLGYLRCAAVRGLEVRERPGRLPGLDQQPAQIGLGRGVVRIRPERTDELANRQPALDDAREAEEGARDETESGQRQGDHDEERQNGIARHPRENAEEKKTPHDLTIEAGERLGQAVPCTWRNRVVPAPGRGRGHDPLME